MSKYQELNKMLAADMPVDYWEDEQQFIAQDLCQTFDESDWDELSNEWPNKGFEWPNKGFEWQQRLCQSLSEAGQKETPVNIVVELAASDSSDVSLTAVDALRSMNITALEVILI